MIACCLLVRGLNTQQYQIERTDTGWQLAKNREFSAIQIQFLTIISIIAIFLHFKTKNNAKKTLVIFNDALKKDNYQSLIVRLKTTVYDATSMNTL